MIDVKKELVSALKQVGLPVYYEMFIDSSTPVPCITYLELINKDKIYSDNLAYSDIEFQVKIWAKDLKTIADNSILIDKKLKQLGFTRTFCAELAHNGIIQKIFRYSCIGIE